jgi:predicted O-methyltransferase YrrM
MGGATGGPAVRDRRAWEWSSEAQMQSYLAGDLPREEYLRDRRRQAETIRLALGLDATHAVFEIGSGEGAVAAALAPQVRELTCVDVSESFLARARETCRGLANVRFQLTRQEYLRGLPAAGYDRGYSWNVFIHLDAYQVFHYLRGVAEVLRPNGLFVFNFVTLGPQTVGFFRTFAEAYPSAWPEQLPGFMRWYDPGLMAAIAVEAGLEPVSGTAEAGGCTLLLRRPAGVPYAEA